MYGMDVALAQSTISDRMRTHGECKKVEGNMKRIIETHYCDICGAEGHVWEINYPVIFLTEQTEGRSCAPYISQKKMEVCDTCLRKTCMIDGWGAQGINTFKIRYEEEA